MRWATSEGRADWLEPHPAVAAILPELHAHGARRALDFGCGVGRHSLLLAEHGFDVEAIDGSLAGLAGGARDGRVARPSSTLEDTVRLVSFAVIAMISCIMSKEVCASLCGSRRITINSKTT